jgi:small subunit ribosomal protein S8
MINDPVADLLTRIRNASMAGLTELSCPFSNLKLNVSNILKNEGYIADVQTENDELVNTKALKIVLGEDSSKVITHIKRISKPGRRVYVKSTNIPRPLRGLGTVIVSTSGGVITGKQAKKLGLGGEILCEIW